MEEPDLLNQILTDLDTAYQGSIEPPPHLEAALGPPGPTGVSDDRVDRWRRDLVARLTGAVPLGRILAQRRTALGVDVADLGHETGWRAERIEELEVGTLDLSHVEPARLALLLAGLRIASLEPIEAPLRDIAERDLAVYSGSTVVHGRSRKGVSAVDHRRDLHRGVTPVDAVATTRAVDRFIAEVNAALQERGA